jgi:hypothetical protein
MRNLSAISLVLCLLGVGVLAQKRSSPRFEDFPVKERFVGKPAPVKLSTRKARMYRTALKREAKLGPNFAGHYIVAIWGCGTFSCGGFGIIDARTGDVYFLPKLHHVTLAWLDQEEREPIKFRKNSRLLILTGELTFEDGTMKTGQYFYLWKNNRLRLIRFNDI